MTTPNPGSPNFEQVWAILQSTARLQKENEQMIKEIGRRQEETARRMKETDRRMEETDRLIKETGQQMKETDRRMAETDQQMKETDRRMEETARQMEETDRRMKETDKRFGFLTGRFGEIVEYMIAPGLLKKFNEGGLHFGHAGPDRSFIDNEHDIAFEVDVMLENGEKAMLVEIKTKLTTEDVKDHTERLEKMRAYADLRGDKRVFLGAVAGVVMTPYVKKYALDRGFYVIEPSGETFFITKPNGEPKEW